MRAIVRRLPRYDYVYLCDTKRVPYGNRSQAEIYRFTRQAVDYLFRHGCGLVIIACNTASAQALRKIQQEYLPRNFPNRRVLGVIRPVAEAVADNQKLHTVGVIGTVRTIQSKAYVRELRQLRPNIKIVQRATPKLVPMIEAGDFRYLDQTLQPYLQPLHGVDNLVLGCTHYPIIQRRIQRFLGSKTTVISPDDIIPNKLRSYLKRHSEINRQLSKRRHRQFLATELTPQLRKLSGRWFKQVAHWRQIELP